MNYLKIILIFSFFLYIFSFTFTTSTDFTQDLGRHLKLGEIIVKTKSVPKTNLFSYTNPNFPFINHHWFSEVFFYLSAKFLGPNSLIYFKLILILVSVMIVFKLAVDQSDFFFSSLTGLILSPLLLERNDVRPEIFGFLFFSIILYLLVTYPKNKKIIYFLPLIMVLWINTHITFVFGVFLILLLIIKILFTKNHYPNILISFLSLFIIILNPHGLTGVFYPFNIFKNYGYTIVENQNLFYLSKMIFNPLIKYFFVFSPVIIISLIILLYKKKIILFILLLTFSLATIFQLRHLPFFVLVAILAVSVAIKTLPIERFQSIVIVLLISIFLSLSVFFISNQYYLIFDQNKSFGVGYDSSGKEAVNYMKNHKLPQPIFNNFDVGGFFIYEFYPQYRVFIDNRPEAYPADFMEKVYKDLQIYPDVQEKIFSKYKIKTIFFNHNDQTQWAEIFISRLYKDKNWQIIYLDPSIIIATTEKNYSDIREDKKNLNNLIIKENNFLNLLKMARFFSLAEEKELFQEAYEKAESINPTSCSIKRSLYNRYQSNSNFYYYKSDELRKNSWYCF